MNKISEDEYNKSSADINLSNPNPNQNINLNDITGCPICLEKFDDKLFKTQLEKCKHLICELCFLNLIKYDNKCPICKTEFFKSYIYKPIELNLNEKTNEITKTTSEANGEMNSINTEENINYITYELSNQELESIQNNKIKEKGIENFECFTKNQITSEVNLYKKMYETIEIKIHHEMKNSKISEKELKIMKETNVNIKTIYELLNQPNENIDNKIILEILSRIITNINHLKQRKYKFEDISDEESDIYKVGDSKEVIKYPIEKMKKRSSKKKFN